MSPSVVEPSSFARCVWRDRAVPRLLACVAFVAAGCASGRGGGGTSEAPAGPSPHGDLAPGSESSGETPPASIVPLPSPSAGGLLPVASAPDDTRAIPAPIVAGPRGRTLLASSFGLDPLWDDGLAEVAVYDATRDRYGRQRRFPLTVIVVKEEMSARDHVKSDAPASEATWPVLKVHVTYEMPTQNYPYRFAYSSFIDRDNPFGVRSYSGSTSEWCGITTRLLRAWEEPARIDYHSYFQGEGDGTHVLVWPDGGVIEEQLLFSVRALPFGNGLEQTMQVLSRQADNRAPAPVWRAGVARVTGPAVANDATGATHSVWHVVVGFDSGDSLVYDVGTESPHLLVYHEAPDGFTMRLREWRRAAYWIRTE